jgi:glucose/arabinose dehydrogenase
MMRPLARRRSFGLRALTLGLSGTLLAVLLSPGGCSPSPPGLNPPPDGSPGYDAPNDVPEVDGSLDGTFCQLPGSLVYAASGEYQVGGGPESPDLTWLHVPTGFCIHYFAHVGNARQLRFAPGGELFVASPSQGTTGGGPGGLASIVVLPDDNGDGYGDAPVIYLGDLPATQGLLFTPGYFYYQDGTMIRRLAYKTGDRMGSGPGEVVVDITVYESSGHWPKTLDAADDGTIYVGNGGDQGEACVSPHPFHGGIVRIDGSPGGAQVAKGFRNPIAVRCQHGHDLCYSTELALDYSTPYGGREKIVPIREGDDWGYPCCASQNLPYSNVFPVPDCSGVAAEIDSFVIAETPFGLDFENGLWPAPWTGSAFVALHGAFGSWMGTRVAAIGTDPTTGALLAGSDNGGPVGALSNFATGWDDGHLDHGRAAELAMSADGRLFIANDVTGDILWVAPIGLGPKKN